MLAVSCRKITLELPEAEKIRLTAYLHKVRDKIHREAITRMFRGHKLIGKLASLVVTNGLFERLYYRSKYRRKSNIVLQIQAAIRS